LSLLYCILLAARSAVPFILWNKGLLLRASDALPSKPFPLSTRPSSPMTASLALDAAPVTRLSRVNDDAPRASVTCSRVLPNMSETLDLAVLKISRPYHLL
jgi:hypothetical protein